MPTVNGKKFAYTPAGQRAAAAARRSKSNPGLKRRTSKLGPPIVDSTTGTKGNLMGKGYNIARNINGGTLPDPGY